MSGKKYLIAFSGVFDLANYGDHLFHVVFEAMMKEKGLDVELYLFSPIACEEALNRDHRKVYALSDLEKMHLEIHFDALIVGGGEIINFLVVKQKFEINADKYIDYPVLQMWIIPSLLAIKYNIRLIWNVPGIPFQFSAPYRHLLKAFCSNADYLSVRNEFSKVAMLECDIPNDKIYVYPDSVFQISKVIDASTLALAANKGKADKPCRKVRRFSHKPLY